ncbi:hypothetical protein Thein_1947 [Thermodesulfatator indicus DSM 15286]|uniref:Uncharacterized protein n=1 Tax=Thermodesulfatator indicus (strain DSM 15286 / JCM 11887 / CIR29812) TaxID=667014 RepID=F8ACM7_THEID|nr:hypothetical protein [Thermodesulfatator indicus]AEH45802.1 hypothetical protein Thein_1947 [Thermodesulfatator indicus DSM 15286]
MKLKEKKYLLKEIGNDLKIDKKLLENYLLPRIACLYDLSKYFLVEKYTQREWKELITLHYINTLYSPSNEVFRIHFFIKNSVEPENYLGFITLRDLPEPNALLSFVYPNFPIFLPQYKKKFQMEDTKFFVMDYPKPVHLSFKEMFIQTFPFYSQDGVVARCAHADIVMVCKYLHKKWNFNSVHIHDIVNSYSFYRTKLFPSDGLLIYQIAEIFANNRIDICIKRYGDFKKDFLNILDSVIESGFPVILATKQHVSVLIGHTLKNNSEKDYIIYDDSGYFL